ncbi:MAG: tyrosine-type recombinase/integrase [Rhodomicrobium sp.]
MTGTIMRVKGIKRYRHPKTGIEYCYHRATGKRIEEPFGTGAFSMRLAQLDAEAKGRAEEKAKAGTLRSLILDYRQSEKFTDLKPRTRKDYDKVFAFLEPILDQSLAFFDTATVIALRNRWSKERGRRFVNYSRSVLSIVFRHGVDELIVKVNPVEDVRPVQKDKNATPLNRKWEPEERAAVWEVCPVHLKLPLAIGLMTGMREGDVLALKRDVVKDGRITILTAKRKVPIDIPISREIREALAGQLPHTAITLCATSRGTPWTTDGFRASFFKLLRSLKEAGKIGSGLTFHGLRHTAASVMAENGASAEDISAVLGWKNSAMAMHYAETADRSRRTKATITKLRPFGRPVKKHET